MASAWEDLRDELAEAAIYVDLEKERKTVGQKAEAAQSAMTSGPLSDVVDEGQEEERERTRIFGWVRDTRSLMQ